MFSNLSFSSISLATETPSLVMRGRRSSFDHHVAALGAQRHLHGVGERVHALENAFARVAAELDVLGSHFKFLEYQMKGERFRGWISR
jgi:hypothetical protein